MSTTFTKAAAIVASSALAVVGAQGVSTAQLSADVSAGSTAGLELVLGSSTQGSGEGGSLDPASLGTLSSVPGTGSLPSDSDEVAASVEGSVGDLSSELLTTDSDEIETSVEGSVGDLSPGSLSTDSDEIETSVSDSLDGSLAPLLGSLALLSSDIGSDAGSDIEDFVTGSLETVSITPGSIQGSVADLGSLAAPLGSLAAPLGSLAAPLGSLTASLGAPIGSLVTPLGSLTASLGAPIGSLGVLLPVALVGGSIAVGASAMPTIQQSLSGGGIQLPPLPPLPAFPGIDTGSLPGQQAPGQQPPVEEHPTAPGPETPNGRG